LKNKDKLRLQAIEIAKELTNIYRPVREHWNIIQAYEIGFKEGVKSGKEKSNSRTSKRTGKRV
jgi:hypothetical protein